LKYLLTSAGARNPSIHNVLLDLLGNLLLSVASCAFPPLCTDIRADDHRLPCFRLATL
jgi:hypothetical protein